MKKHYEISIYSLYGGCWVEHHDFTREEFDRFYDAQVANNNKIIGILIN